MALVAIRLPGFCVQNNGTSVPCTGSIAKVDAIRAIAEDIAQLRRAVQVEAGRRYALLSAERVIWEVRCWLGNGACSLAGALSVALARSGVGDLSVRRGRRAVGDPRAITGFETIAFAFVRLTASGVLPHHVGDTVLGLVTGFVLAAIVGIAIGNCCGASRGSAVV